MDLDPGSIWPFLDELAEIQQPSPDYRPVELDGKEYDPYNRGLVFGDWLEYFLGSAQEKRSLLGFHLARKITQLMHNEDRAWLAEQGADLESFNDYPEFCFVSGAYEEIPENREDDVWELKYADGKFQIQQNHRIRICSQFRDLGLVGNSADLVLVLAQIDHICSGIRQYDKLPNVLLVGEPGTGKELLARSFHELAKRKGEFRVVNCAGIPTELLESELFGHVKGAFTGAAQDKIGLLEECNHGTIQLDEIDKMGGYLSDKLLRALGEKEIRRVGSNQTMKLDALVVATTNADSVGSEAFQGRFAITVDVPNLEARIDDIPLLVNHFLADYPDNPVDDYRLPVALWCNSQVEVMSSNIRSLESLVMRQVYHFSDPNIIVPSPKELALRRAFDEAMKAGEASPISQRKLAGYVMTEKGKSLSGSTLQDEPWRRYIDIMIGEGKVRARKT